MQAIYFILLILPPLIEAKSLLKNTFQYQGTSDHLYLRSNKLEFQQQQHDPFFPYPNQAGNKKNILKGVIQFHSGDSSQGKFKGQEALGLWGRAFSQKFYAEIGPGVHQLEENKIFTYNAALYYTSYPLFYFFNAHKNFVYPELALPAGFTKKLRFQSFSFKGTHYLHKKIRFFIHPEFRNYSSNNSRFSLDLALTYGILPTTPWLWLGLGYNYLGFEKIQSSYWTPRGYSSFGPRIEGSFELIWNLATRFGVNINRLYDNESHQYGNGLYLFSSLDYGKREGLFINIEYIKIESLQNASTWSSQSLAFNIKLGL